MTTLGAIWNELVGLFVDDGSLAVAILAVVLLSGFVAMVAPGIPLAAGAILLFGTLGALLTSVMRARQR
jgi:hypothetical protein